MLLVARRSQNSQGGFVLLDAIAASVVLALVGTVIMGIYVAASQQMTTDLDGVWRAVQLKSLAIEVMQRGVNVTGSVPSADIGGFVLGIGEVQDDTLPPAFRRLSLRLGNSDSDVEVIAPVRK
jgi:hypothetical protein